MRQHQQGGLAYIVRCDPRAGLQGGDGAGGLVHDDVGPQAGHFELAAEMADQLQHGIVQHHVRQQSLGLGHLRKQGVLLRLPALGKGGGIGLEGDASAHYLGPHGLVGWCAHFHHEAEAVQQLRPQIALFQVHGADQREARWMADGDALALH